MAKVFSNATKTSREYHSSLAIALCGIVLLAFYLLAETDAPDQIANFIQGAMPSAEGVLSAR